MPVCLEIITEEDLHLYTDGSLSAEERAAMDEFLQEDDEARQRVDAYRMQIAELHRWLSPTLVEPVPERLLEALRSATAGHATAEPMSASV